MAKSWHPAKRRRLEGSGPSIRSWRRACGLSATEVADRSGISRTTLRQIETDPSGVSFGNVFAVLSVLSIDHKVAQAVDPFEDVVGRTLILSAGEEGPLSPPGGVSPFGALDDAGPDSWGRRVIRRSRTLNEVSTSLDRFDR